MNKSLLVAALSRQARLTIVQGDITEERCDAIVNAANERLAHGAGVAGAIVRKGGEEIQRESDEYVRKNGPVATGCAASTCAGALAARHVIHAVGPIWGSGDEVNKLASAVKAALKLADGARCKSLSLPAISSGIYGFPADLCAQVILGAIQEYIDAKPGTSLREICVCLFDAEMAELFTREAQARFKKR